MKKWILTFATVALLLSGTAAAQNKTKALTISGKVGDDGKTLLGQNNSTWSVLNPDTLVGHAGQQVKVKCRVSPENHDIRILSVKALDAQTTYVANKGDSAFRR
jgi:hypothetical protein